MWRRTHERATNATHAPHASERARVHSNVRRVFACTDCPPNAMHYTHVGVVGRRRGAQSQRTQAHQAQRLMSHVIFILYCTHICDQQQQCVCVCVLLCVCAEKQEKNRIFHFGTESSSSSSSSQHVTKNAYNGTRRPFVRKPLCVYVVRVQG